MALEFLSPLHKASRQISIYLDGHTRQMGVSPVEGHLLSYLRRYAPAPIAELVRVFGIKQSTFTSMIDRLERAGYLRRDVNPGDRRSFLIVITPEGVELADRLNELLERLEQSVRDQVSPEQIEGFRAVMAAMETVTRVRLRER